MALAGMSGGGDAGPMVLAVRPQPGELGLADAASLSGDEVLSRLGSSSGWSPSTYASSATLPRHLSS